MTGCLRLVLPLVNDISRSIEILSDRSLFPGRRAACARPDADLARAENAVLWRSPLPPQGRARLVGSRFAERAGRAGRFRSVQQLEHGREEDDALA
jgi:hypothetical protein